MLKIMVIRQVIGTNTDDSNVPLLQTRASCLKQPKIIALIIPQTHFTKSFQF